MGLVTSKEMFEKAYEGGYAIGAFNVNNMEIVQGIMEAAVENNAPVILQVSAGARKYANPVYLKKLVESAIECNKQKGVDIPVVLHLDHGPDFETCKDCIDGGFTSVMIDASKYDFETNVEMTKKVVEYAHERGVADSDAMYTSPAEAEEFVKRTGCDSLAIAIGTSHGAYKFKGEPKLRYDILEEVSRRLPGFPIVLHGASSVPQEFVQMCNEYGGNIPGAKGVPEEMLRKAATMAVCKINIDSDIRLAMTANIRKVFKESPEVFDPRTYLGEARKAVKDMVSHKIVDVLGCNDKA